MMALISVKLTWYGWKQYVISTFRIISTGYKHQNRYGTSVHIDRMKRKCFTNNTVRKCSIRVAHFAGKKTWMTFRSSSTACASLYSPCFYHSLQIRVFFLAWASSLILLLFLYSFYLFDYVNCESRFNSFYGRFRKGGK